MRPYLRFSVSSAHQEFESNAPTPGREAQPASKKASERVSSYQARQGLAARPFERPQSDPRMVARLGGEYQQYQTLNCWRRGWDSNPRYGYPYNGFRVLR